MLKLLLFRCVRCRLQVAIKGRAVEGDYDDFAPVTVVAVLLFLFDVNHSQGQRGDMAVFDVDARTLQFAPAVDGAVGVTDKIFCRS